MYNEYSQELIQEILDKINIVDYIGKYIKLTQQGRDHFGICPFHEESDASFSVSLEKNIFFCFGCGAGYNLIDFVMMYHKLKFIDSINHLIKYSNLDITKIKPTFETVKLLKKFNRQLNYKNIQHEILPINIMNKYNKNPIYEWLKEGINENIMDEYQVRFDEKNNRAVFPIYDVNGNIINIKGRTLYEKYRELGIPKYIYYYSLGTNDFLYGFHKKAEVIKDTNEIIVFEGEKSVWKLDGWGIKNSVAIATSRLNEHQIRLLLKTKANIIIAFDKGVDIKAIKEQCNKLIKFTDVYVVYDKEKVLKDKESPVDLGLDVWLDLYSKKIKL